MLRLRYGLPRLTHHWLSPAPQSSRRRSLFLTYVAVLTRCHLPAYDSGRRNIGRTPRGGTGGLHIGVAINHIDGMDDLIRRADEHMYERRTDT